MEWLHRLRQIREFSEEFERIGRREGYGKAVIHVTDVPHPCGMLGWLDGAVTTLLQVIEFRSGRE